MLDIIILIFLSIRIGNLAVKKGLKRRAWILYTVLSWLAGEVIGVVAGVAIFEQDNIVSIVLMGLAGAIGGYFIIKSVLDKKPDPFDDDIKRIGVDDLKP
jgi:hypothetical protein